MSPARSTPSAALRSLWKTAIPAVGERSEQLALDMGLGNLAEGARRGAEVEQGRDPLAGEEDLAQPDRFGLEHEAQQ